MATGREALGNATILGGSINPLQVLMSQSTQREKQRQAKLAELKKQREAVHDYNDKFNPEGKWEPLKQRVAEVVSDHRRKSFDLIEAAGGDSTKMSSAKRDILNGQGMVNQYIAEQERWKQKYEEANKMYDNNIKAGLYKDDKHPLRDVLYNDDGTLKSDNEIRAGMAHLDDTIRHPNNFNEPGVWKNFVDQIPVNATNLLTNSFNELGQQWDNQKLETQVGVKRDAQGNVVMNLDTGKPQLSATDVNIILAKKDPMTSALIERDLGPNATIQQIRDYVTSKMEPFDKTKLENTRQLGFKIPQKDRRYYHFGAGGYGYTHQKADLEGRDEILNRVVSGTSGKDMLSYFGNITKDIQADYATNPVVDKKQLQGKFIKIDFTGPVPTYNFKTGVSTRDKMTTYLPINTEDERREAKIALSQRMDEIHKPSALGEEYPTYINEKRKHEEKNKPNGSNSLNASQWKKKAQ